MKDMEDIATYIKNRRSIFPGMYSGEKVEDSVIDEMLESANWAPTNKLTEPWRFIVYTGKGLEKLGNDQAELYAKVSKAKGSFVEKTYETLRTKPTKASHVIAIIMRRDPEGRVPEVEEISSVAMAVQNMYLTASAKGIGCYWGTGGITYFKEANELFGLDEKDKFLGYLFVGKPKSEWPTGKRSPIAEKVQWVS